MSAKNVNDFRGNKPTDLLRLLMLLVIIILFGVEGSYADEGKDARVSKCRNLERIFQKEGWLRTAKMREDYCLYGCTFRGACKQQTERKPGLGWLSNFTDSLFDGTFESSFDEHIMDFDEDVKEAMYDVLWHIVPFMTCLVPILLNQYKRYNFLVAVLLLFVYGLLNWLLRWDVGIFLHNAAMTMVCLYHPPDHIKIQEYLAPQLVVTCAILLMIAGNEWVKLGTVLCLFILYGFYVHYLFFVKREGGSAGAFIVICQVFVLWGQLLFIREQLMESSLIGVSIEICLSAIMPYSREGSSRYYLVNSLVLAKTFAKKLKVPTHYHEISFFMWFAENIMFVVFRGSYGAFCIYELRYKTDFDSFLAGVYVYTVDFFGPVTVIYRAIFGYERNNPRRAYYAAVGALLLYSEFQGAMGMFVIRFFMSLIDKIVIRSHYGRVSHYLNYDIGFGNESFPQHKSIAWNSVDKLSKAASGVRRITVTRKDGSVVNGLGFLNKNGSGSDIYTVDHVVREGVSLSCSGGISMAPVFTKVSGGDDPVVSMTCDEPSEADVSILSHNETNDVSHLVFVSLDDEKRPYMNCVSDFKLGKNEVKVTVDLKKGDSGGPVFAALRNGSIRYCGAVSKGNRNKGAGNIVSLVTADAPDLDSDGSLDSDDRNVTKFNKVRRLEDGRNTERQPRYKAMYDLHAYWVENKQDLIALGKCKDPHKPKLEEILFGDIEELSVLPFLSTNRKTDSDDEGKEKSKSARKRQTFKDKAMRKRAMLAMRNFKAYLRNVYSEVDTNGFLAACYAGYDLPIEADSEMFGQGSGIGTCKPVDDYADRQGYKFD